MCEKCGSPMVVRSGRYGPFLACSNYPACKNIQPFPLGIRCAVPGCPGEIQQQRSRRGKMYYSCSEKGCSFISWSRPVERKCPSCGAGFMTKKGKTLVCPNPQCGHSEDE